MSKLDPDALKIVKEQSRPTIAFGVARIPDSKRAFLGSSDFKVSEINLGSDKYEGKDLYSHESYVTSVALAGTTLVSGGYDGMLSWWDTASNKKIRTEPAHSKWIRQVIASPDGKRIASVADDMLCKVWDVATGKLIFTLKGHEERTPHHFPSMLYGVCYSADGKLLATCDKIGHIIIWDAVNGRAVAYVESPGMYTWDPVQRRHSIGGARSVAFSPDGKHLACGGIGKIGNIDHLDGKARMEVFDWQAGKSIWISESEKYKGLVNRLQFAPDGSWLLGAGGSGEGFMLFYDIKEKKILRQDKLSMHVHDFAMSPKADSYLFVGHNRLIYAEMK